MASLVSHDGTSFELTETETLVGRGGRELSDPPKVDVGPLPGGPTVSRRHARIVRRQGQWYLRVEPEARNPTFVGGHRVPGGEEVPLSDNTTVQLGEVTLIFRAPDAAPAHLPEATMAGDAGHPPELSVSQPPPIPAPAAAPSTEEPIATAVTTPRRTADWPARLPERPAAITTLGVQEFKRVNPFRGLMIDESAWADAHDYHRLQARLHLLSAHGWGIVEGLEVIADPQVPNTLLVRPGIAFDNHGRPMIVGQDRRLTINQPDGATLYIVLRWREELTAPQRFWNDLDEYTRVVERCDILLQESPPVPPLLELARLTISGPVRNAPDPLNPQPGEIDLRYRERLMVRPRPDLAVALLAFPGDTTEEIPLHLAGIRYLLREIGLSTGYRPRWAGVVHVGDPIPPVSLLYSGGSRPVAVTGPAVDRLRDFLSTGGVFLLDACAEGNCADFIGSAEALAAALGSSLAPVDRDHPLLTARHVFAEPPPGASNDTVTLVEGNGVVVTSADYGCAWQGGRPGQALPRERVRAALEIGVNAAVFARQRQRPLDVIELEA
jgi:pSer/pThr/pTyr-binding forkhead associated (FHA) protein